MLRGVILGWMDCVLLAQRDSTKEGIVEEIQQNTKFYQYTVPHLLFLLVQGKVLLVKISMCQSNRTSVKSIFFVFFVNRSCFCFFNFLCFFVVVFCYVLQCGALPGLPCFWQVGAYIVGAWTIHTFCAGDSHYVITLCSGIVAVFTTAFFL